MDRDSSGPAPFVSLIAGEKSAFPTYHASVDELPPGLACVQAGFRAAGRDADVRLFDTGSCTTGGGILLVGLPPSIPAYADESLGRSGRLRAAGAPKGARAVRLAGSEDAG